MGSKQPPKKKCPAFRPYQLIVVLDAQDHKALEEIVRMCKLTRADTIRLMIRAKARNLQGTHPDPLSFGS